MTNTPQGFAADAETMTAMVEAMHALAKAFTEVLPPEQQQKVANSLALDAQEAEQAGDLILETLLIDLHTTVKEQSQNDD